MGVYINMEMPKSCFQCEFRTKIDPDNLMCIISQKTFEERFCHIESRDKSCPLVPVPPHGRLIDADVLLKPKNQHVDVLADEWYVTVRTIETAPAIIPASRKEGEE